MPSAKEHLSVGASTGVAVNAFFQLNEMQIDPGKRFDLGELITSSVLGAVAALIPDMLEPATSPSHRAFFHSLGAGGLVAFLLTSKRTEHLDRTSRTALLAIAIGYLSHLAADSTTPASIRLL